MSHDANMADRKPLTQSNMIIFAAELRRHGMDKPYPVTKDIGDRLVISRWLHHIPPATEQASSQTDLRAFPSGPEPLPLLAVPGNPSVRPSFRDVAEGTVPAALRVAAQQRNAESDNRKPPSTAELALGTPQADTPPVDNGSPAKSGGSPAGKDSLSSNKTLVPRRFKSHDAQAEDQPEPAGRGNGRGRAAKAASD